MKANVADEQRREAIKAALKTSPQLSNRAIGARVGAHHVTVGKVRNLLESAGELSKVDKALGADGKVYSRRKHVTHADGPTSATPICGMQHTNGVARVAREPRPDISSQNVLARNILAEQVSRANASLMQTAREDGRLDELADALHALADRLSTRAKGVEVPHQAAEPIAPPLFVPITNNSKPAANAPPAHVRSWQEVVRDIDPGARVHPHATAAHDDVDRVEEAKTGIPVSGAEERPAERQLPPEGSEWAQGRIVHLHVFTQCGRVHVPEFGELNFTDHTPRGGGLVLEPGLAVACRVKLRPDGGVRVVELAKAHVVA